jgi:DHA1 family inner membrane transport protein
MLILLMACSARQSDLCARASFGVMVVGRLVAACADGAFFGIDSVVAADLVTPHKKTRAILMMFVGLTVVGVPLDAYVGQSVGWRVTLYRPARPGRHRQAGARRTQAGWG